MTHHSLTDWYTIGATLNLKPQRFEFFKSLSKQGSIFTFDNNLMSIEKKIIQICSFYFVMVKEQGSIKMNIRWIVCSQTLISSALYYLSNGQAVTVL